MNTNLHTGNGTDTFTVSQNAPVSDLIEHMSDTYDDRMMLLSDLRNLQSLIDDEIWRVIKAERERGRSWSEVGNALGMSKQGAQQRYGD